MSTAMTGVPLWGPSLCTHAITWDMGQDNVSFLQIPLSFAAYTQNWVLKKTLGTMHLDAQQELEDRLGKEIVTKELQSSCVGEPWGQHQRKSR